MTFPLTTTLNRIHACRPCAYGWRRGLTALGKTQGDDEPLSFAELVDLRELDDVLWCCRSAPEHDAYWRRFAGWCAREVQDQLTDPRSRQALDVAERHAAGAASDDELAVAGAAAWAAARAAAGAARAAAGAAGAAARAARAAGAAARAAAWAAAGAAEAAAWAAAQAAAGAAEAAAWAAARAAAREAEAAARQRQALAFRQLVTDGTLPPQGGEVEG